MRKLTAFYLIINFVCTCLASPVDKELLAHELISRCSGKYVEIIKGKSADSFVIYPLPSNSIPGVDLYRCEFAKPGMQGLEFVFYYHTATQSIGVLTEDWQGVEALAASLKITELSHKEAYAILSQLSLLWEPHPQMCKALKAPINMGNISILFRGADSVSNSSYSMFAIPISENGELVFYGYVKLNGKLLALGEMTRLKGKF